MNLKNIYNIIKKELRSYFDSPTAYIILVVFLLLWEFLFFRSVFLAGRASLTGLFGLFPWLALLLLPPLTMGSISKEKDKGTLEFLLTQPVDEKEVVLGKFLACLKFAMVAVLLTLPVALSLANFGDLDWGVVLGQYLAAFFYAMVALSLGIFISSLFKNQIVSLLLTIVGLFGLLVMGTEMVTMTLPFVIGGWLRGLSISSHFSSLARGVIDLRAVWYFISMTALFLTAAFFYLKKRKYGHSASGYGNLKLFVLGMALLVVFSNALGAHIPGRLDITENRIYTLSPATKEVLSELGDSIEITVYASEKLPPRFQEVLRNTKNMLTDYRIQGGNKVKVNFKYPSQDPEVRTEAYQAGIQRMQFNVVAEEEFKVKQGYLGLLVEKDKQKEVIPFIKNTDDLEYKLTGFIKKLTTIEKKKIVFLSSRKEKTLSTDYSVLEKELKKQFEVQQFSFGEDSQSLPEDTDVLVVTDSQATSSIKNYLEANGSALFLVDMFDINPQGLQVAEAETNLSGFLKQYGVGVEKNIVYDLKSKETISFGGGSFNMIMPYPFWARALAVDKTSSVVGELKSIVLPWASSFTTIPTVLEEKGLDAKTIFATTEYGGEQTDGFNLSPRQQLSQANLKNRALVMRVEEQQVQQGKEGTRFIVVGDSDFLSDNVAGRFSENLAFGLQAISWLAQEDSLAGIRMKSRGPSELLFDNGTQKKTIKYGNMAWVVIAPLAVGFWRLMRRRRLQKMSYEGR